MQKVKIIKGLSLAIAANKQLRKSFEVYFILKSIDKKNNGTFNYNTQSEKAINLLLFHKKTLKNRLEWCVNYGLCKYCKNTGLFFLKSYDKIAAMYNLKPIFETLKFDQQTQRLEYWLQAKAIQEKDQQCRLAYLRKLSKSPQIQQHLKNVLGNLNTPDITKAQILNYLTNGNFSNNEDVNYILSVLRADTSISVSRYSEIFGQKNKNGFCYYKKRLKDMNLISVEKREVIQGFCKKTTIEQRNSILGTHFYNRETKKVHLRLPDLVKIQMPNNPQTLLNSII